MDTPDTPIVPPTDISGVAIHLSYLRKDISNLSRQVESMGVKFVTATDFAEHIKTDDDHESRIRAMESIVGGIKTTMKVWGTVGGVALALLEVGLHFIR